MQHMFECRFICTSDNVNICWLALSQTTMHSQNTPVLSKKPWKSQWTWMVDVCALESVSECVPLDGLALGSWWDWTSGWKRREVLHSPPMKKRVQWIDSLPLPVLILSSSSSIGYLNVSSRSCANETPALHKDTISNARTWLGQDSQLRV